MGGEQNECCFLRHAAMRLAALGWADDLAVGDCPCVLLVDIQCKKFKREVGISTGDIFLIRPRDLSGKTIFELRN
jgi:hypothetical protein